MIGEILAYTGLTVFVVANLALASYAAGKHSGLVFPALMAPSIFVVSVAFLGFGAWTFALAAVVFVLGLLAWFGTENQRGPDMGTFAALIIAWLLAAAVTYGGGAINWASTGYDANGNNNDDLQEQIDQLRADHDALQEKFDQLLLDLPTIYATQDELDDAIALITALEEKLYGDPDDADDVGDIGRIDSDIEGILERFDDPEVFRAWFEQMLEGQPQWWQDIMREEVGAYMTASGPRPTDNPATEQREQGAQFGPAICSQINSVGLYSNQLSDYLDSLGYTDELVASCQEQWFQDVLRADPYLLADVARRIGIGEGSQVEFGDALAADSELFEAAFDDVMAAHQAYVSAYEDLLEDDDEDNDEDLAQPVGLVCFNDGFVRVQYFDSDGRTIVSGTKRVAVCENEINIVTRFINPRTGVVIELYHRIHCGGQGTEHEPPKAPEPVETPAPEPTVVTTQPTPTTEPTPQPTVVTTTPTPTTEAPPEPPTVPEPTPTSTTAAPTPTTEPPPEPTTTTTEPPVTPVSFNAGLWCDLNVNPAIWRVWVNDVVGEVTRWSGRDNTFPGRQAVTHTVTAYWGNGQSTSVTFSKPGDCGKDADDLPPDDPVDPPAEPPGPPEATPPPPVTLPPQTGTPGGGEPDPEDPNPLPPGGDEGTDDPEPQPDPEDDGPVVIDAPPPAI